ncbi:RNA polymerase sigma factor [Crateriforma conspicua]|uniref:RNA polymerase sigma factor RpoE n=1 Tax=Crateriforma conspicua TaxID=2527996 RepID=A0A5C6FUQ5_9PLAN|nr:sigma-70 family RNA polymerase sigma factor [Crateriforma conspicua]TWU65285.1 RNA polymerase sigma factor RpoE [Crateriforma conspicua]
MSTTTTPTMNLPETRASLLIRLRDRDDAAAWQEFVQIYRPVIVRVATAKGIQRADADDLAQQVLMSVCGAIDRFDHASNQAKFRTWLRRIADNATLNALTRGRPDRGSGDSALQRWLDQQPDPDPGDSRMLQTELRREHFQAAARAVRGEFSDATWQSFWRTAVLGENIDDVSDALGRTKGSVYASRSRVMRRIREKVEPWQ